MWKNERASRKNMRDLSFKIVYAEHLEKFTPIHGPLTDLSTRNRKCKIEYSQSIKRYLHDRIKLETRTGSHKWSDIFMLRYFWPCLHHKIISQWPLIVVYRYYWAHDQGKEHSFRDTAKSMRHYAKVVASTTVMIAFEWFQAQSQIAEEKLLSLKPRREYKLNIGPYIYLIALYCLADVLRACR